MLLRSSSTPVLGSLLSSISDSPNHNHHYHPEVPPHTANKHPPTTIPHSHKKVSFHQSGPQNFTTFSCNSSPISPSIAEFSGVGRCSGNGFRRAQSEGNLENLASGKIDNEEFSISHPPKKFSRRPNSSMLQTIPSFSFPNSTSIYEDECSDDDYEDDDREELGENVELSNNAIRGDDRFKAANNKLNMEKQQSGDLNKDLRYVNAYGNVSFEEQMAEVRPHMYLARGLGVTGFDIGYGSGGRTDGGDGGGSGGGGGEGNSVEEHYKRMVEENPENSLFLRNYAQFLYQTKQDLQGAEEYYSRAILADPKDGEILSQYAKLVWELHRDEARATSYFERAVQTASEDSHVHAAYASFLWQLEDEDESDELNDPHVLPPLLQMGSMASATV